MNCGQKLWIGSLQTKSYSGFCTFAGHRGFKSNRKAEIVNADAETGMVLSAINEIKAALEEGTYRTFGRIYACASEIRGA